MTAFNAKMENVHCSPIQRMIVNSADYGSFNNIGTFAPNAAIDIQCSRLTNCQVKSLCAGNRSCELTMDNNLLPSQYCPDTSKQIYTKYTCVDEYKSDSITGNVDAKNTFLCVISVRKGVTLSFSQLT